MTQYESVIIITPLLSEEQVKDSIAKYRQLITSEGGKVVSEESWGLTKMAYPISKKNSAFYHLFEFTANDQFVSKWELTLKRDERVLRYMTVTLDKHSIAYNQRRRNGELNSQKAKKEAETANA